MKNKYLIPDDIRLNLLREFINHFDKRVLYTDYTSYVCPEFNRFLNPYGSLFEKDSVTFQQVFPEYYVIKNDNTNIWLTCNIGECEGDSLSARIKQRNEIKLYALELLYNYIKNNPT